MIMTLLAVIEVRKIAKRAIVILRNPVEFLSFFFGESNRWLKWFPFYSFVSSYVDVCIEKRVLDGVVILFDSKRIPTVDCTPNRNLVVEILIEKRWWSRQSVLTGAATGCEFRTFSLHGVEGTAKKGPPQRNSRKRKKNIGFYIGCYTKTALTLVNSLF